MLTSSKEDQDLFASYSLGVNSYVRKPVAFEEFYRAVGQVGTYWLGLNEALPVTD
jgi:two-component system, response regulator